MLRAFALVALTSSVSLVATDPTGTVDRQTVELRPSFEVGQSRYVEWRQNTTSTVTGLDEGKKVNEFRQTWGVIETVEAITPDGDVTIRLQFDRIAHSFGGDKERRACDSDWEQPHEDDDHPLGPLFQRMLGGRMTMVLDNQGRVKSFTGMDDIYAAVEKSFEDDPDRMTLLARLKRLRSNLTDDIAATIWGDAPMSLYAFKPVKVGDTWERRLTRMSSGSGRIIIEVRSRVASIDNVKGRKVLTVKYDSKLRQATDTDEDLQPLAENCDSSVKDLTGTFSGEAKFEVDLGVITTDRDAGQIQFSLDLPPGDNEEARKLHVVQDIQAELEILTLEQRESQKRRNARVVKRHR